MRMRLEMTGVIVYTTNNMWCYIIIRLLFIYSFIHSFIIYLYIVVCFDLFVRGVRIVAVYTNHNTPECRQSDLVTHEAFF